MKNALLLGVLVFVIQVREAWGDKVYMKSGEVIEGKVVDDKRIFRGFIKPDPQSMIDPVYIWHGTFKTGDAVPRADIDHIEKGLPPAAGPALLVQADRWGEVREGWRTQVVTSQASMVIGQPMPFSVIARNESDRMQTFDASSFGGNVFSIKDSRGHEVPNKFTPVQTLFSPYPVDVGETVSFIYEQDITQDYVITEPGTYTIQFRGPIFPPSNVLGFYIQRGANLLHEQLISRIMKVVPDAQWSVHARDIDGHTAPSGRANVAGVEVQLIFTRGPDALVVPLWQTETAAELLGRGWKIWMPHRSPADYLGEGPLGHSYVVIPKDAEETWPTMRADLKAALGIH